MAAPARPTQDPPTVETRTTFTVRWRLSGPALRRSRSDLQLGESDAALSIHITLEAGRFLGVRAAIETNDDRTCPIETSHERGSCRVDGDLLHLEIPSLLATTIRQSDAKLLYARTPLLEGLGLAPGTYEPVGCCLTRE